MSTQRSIASCQTCGEPLEAGWDQCPSCLAPTSMGELTCPECGKEIKSKWKQCPSCKTTLDGWVAPTGSTTTPEQSQKTNPSRIGLTLGGDGGGEPVDSGLDFAIETGDILVERYTVRKLLGSGNFGAVYLASDEVLQKDIALKIVQTGEGKARRATEQLLHEFQLREKITDTSHILRTYDPRQADYKNLPILILPMELADAGSLRKWMVKNPQQENRFNDGMGYFVQACKGVQAIHSAGLVHLDIKPENILIVDGKIKIADFGIGRFGAAHFGDNPEQLLRQGVGTPQYMSPEQFKVARQKDVGPASDLYSLGIILYELLDGNPPFDGSPVELRDKHLEINPSPITGAAEQWWKIVKRCLEKKTEDRYANVGQLIGDLQRVSEGNSLLVEASCPNCSHINSNTNAKECEQCHEDLTSLFRLCPSCAREVRMDLEMCPGCGKEVSSYYLLQELKERIEKIKDEDPVEAIELLENLMRNGADEYSEWAASLVKELREKQSRISQLIHQAEQAGSSGDLNKAVNAWKEILNLVPRHRVALQRYSKINTEITEVEQRMTQACEQADKGRFSDAESLVRECLALRPSLKKAKKLLASFSKRAKNFTTSVEEAESSLKAKEIYKAAQHIERALSAAPRNKNALGLDKKIHSILSSTMQLLDRADEQMACANYSGVQSSISKIEKQQSDEPLEELKERMRTNQIIFDAGMRDFESAMNRKAIYEAKNQIDTLLSVAPQHKRILTCEQQVDLFLENTEDLIIKTREFLDSADFDEVEKCISRIEEWQLDEHRLEDLKVELSETREGFLSSMDQYQSTSEENDWSQALYHANHALENCPNSEWAISCRDRAEQLLDILIQSLDIVDIALLNAQFKEVKDILLKAEKSLYHYEPYIEINEKCLEIEETYTNEIDRAKQLLKSKKYEMAQDACQSALAICPSASEPNELLNAIAKSEFLDEERRIQRIILRQKIIHHAKILFTKTGLMILSLVLLIAVIAGMYYGWIGGQIWFEYLSNWISQEAWPWLLKKQIELAGMGAGLLVLTSIVHCFRYTNWYRWIFRTMTNSYKRDHTKSMFLTGLFVGLISASIVLLICGLCSTYLELPQDHLVTLGLFVMDILLCISLFHSWFARSDYTLRY